MQTKIRDHNEGLEVEIEEKLVGDTKRLVIVALNQAGYDATEVDLLDVIEWVRENKPELLEVKNVVG